jgi:RimJ/RimL family protein N-acetyltransferase
VTPLELRTDRLRLHRWTDADRVAFAALNADPVVMEHFPSTLTLEQSNAVVDRAEAAFEKQGLGLWAVEVTESSLFAGYIGLWQATFEAHFTPAIEIGWRFAKEFWGNGYATEGARVVLADGFERLGVDEIVSFTATVNERSWRVMERIGMTHDPADDFDHPTLEPGHRLERHVLYRINR